MDVHRLDIVVTAITSPSIALAELGWVAISGSCCHYTFQAAIQSPTHSIHSCVYLAWDTKVTRHDPMTSWTTDDLMHIAPYKLHGIYDTKPIMIQAIESACWCKRTSVGHVSLRQTWWGWMTEGSHRSEGRIDPELFSARAKSDDEV